MLATTIDIGKEFILRQECRTGAPLSRCNPADIISVPITQIPAYESLGGVVSAVLPTAFVLAGLILFILIVFGGLMVVINAGSGDPKHAEQGKSAATAALLGMAVVFCAWWIIKIVEFVTGIKIF